MTHTSSPGIEVRRSRSWTALGAALVATAMMLGGAGCKGRTTTATNTTGAATASGGSDCSAIATSGPNKFEAANYWGHEISTLRDQHDLQACARACAADANCKVASFIDATGPAEYQNTCVLRGAVGERHTEQAGICSWVKP